MTAPQSLNAIELVEQLNAFAQETVLALPEHLACGKAGLSFYDPEFGVVCGGCAATTYVMHPTLSIEMDPAVKVGEPERQAVAETTTKLVATKGDIASRVDPGDPITTPLVLIDPTQPYDSAMVEEHILDAVARLERGSHFQRVCMEEYAESVLAYELKYARALLQADKDGGAADVRKARAMIMCEQEYVTRHVAKMKCSAIETTMHSLRSVLSGYQSVSSSIRAAYGGTGRQGP